MRWMKRMWLASLISLTLSRVASAQLPVIDAANLTQNTISAVQSILIVANQLLDLLAVDAFVLDDGTFMDDLATLQGLAANVQGIGWDLESLEAQITTLFALENAPDNTSDLTAHIQQVRGSVWQAYVDAMRVQTLLRTIIHTVNHIIGVYGTIQNLVGNLQGAQAAGQYQAKMNQTLAELQAQTATFERAKSLEGIDGPFIEQSLANIDQAILADHPQPQ
jgi:conjugal transfer/entry exclusion protein